MSRTPKTAPDQVEDAISTERMAQAELATQELVVIQRQQNAEVSLLATQLGYDGDLSIGSLEDGIRFYQRRTVEACLELGKRLVLLKSVTPVGEFTARVELMGFHERAARRFMSAALKTSKSDNLSALSTRIKSASAFLELVMVDDEDTLKAIAEMDDVDRMPASELRKAVRDLKANSEANDKLLAAKDKKINMLTRKGQAVAFTEGVHIFSTLIEQINKAKHQIEAECNALDLIITAATSMEIEEVDAPAAQAAYIALARAFKDTLDERERAFAKVASRFENTIALVADEATN